MRNPDRIAGFLNQMRPYENQILTTDIIFKIIYGVIRNKLYKPSYINRNDLYKEIWNSEEITFDNSQIIDIINNTPQHHKEAGYDYGWESRFQTWYSLSQEFGFVYYSKGTKLLISESGHLLIDAYNQDTPDEEKIQNVFLNAMVKYQSNNPYRKNSNTNIPLVLLLKVLILLREKPIKNNSNLSRSELSLFICWNDFDADSLYKLIEKIRNDVGFNCTDEYMYNICLEILGYKSNAEKELVKNYFKIEKICGESVDEYIRKMRSTGIISLKGNGRFLGLNSFESNKIDFILSNYNNLKEFESKEDYYKYLGSIDNHFILLHNEVNHEVEYNVKINTLYDIAKKYSKEEILEELLILSAKKESRNPIFKYIPAPTRLEFLTSISLAQTLKKCIIQPNYSIDDEGYPTMTARGNVPDIVCMDPENFMISNIEVTLMRGRTDQVNNEMIPIKRHLVSINKPSFEVFALFIAPTIHDDTKEIAAWFKHKDNVNIYTYSIDEYVKIILNSRYLNDLIP